MPGTLKDMRVINFNTLLCVYENSNLLKNRFDSIVRPQLDLLKDKYEKFSMVRAYNYLLPFAQDVFDFLKVKLSKEDILPKIEEIDLDEFCRILLKRYLEEK